MKKILVLNSGSSSLKYQLFNVDGDKYDVVAKGLAERIGIDGSKVGIKYADGSKKEVVTPLPTHNEALQEVFCLPCLQPPEKLRAYRRYDILREWAYRL